MKRIFLIILLSSYGFSSRSQTDYPLYEFPEKLPSEYKFDIKKEFNDAKKETGKLLAAKYKDQFAERMTAMKVSSILSGEVYIGWEEMESYLNEILKKIIPETYKKNQRIHVYPIRNSDFNAFTIHDGTIYFNVSLFSEASNEASIAFILGHELSHFINHDVVRAYNLRTEKENKKKKKDPESFYSYEVEMAEYSKAQEVAADSLGAVLTANAGYDLDFAVGCFYKFKNLSEQNYEKQSSSRITMAHKNEEEIMYDSLDRIEDQILASHPDMLKRISNFSTYNRKFNKAGSKEYLVGNAEKFNKLKTQTRIESLSILLNELDYRECVSRAFSYYLLEGSDIYLYYLLEGMRIGFAMNHRLPEKPFLTDDLRAGIFEKGEGILHNLHAQIRDTSDFKLIKKSPLTDSENIAFEIWDEAFNYFADLAIEKNYAESYLPIALRNSDTIPLRNYFLDKYLASPGKKYSEFARAVRDDKIVETFSTNNVSLVLFDNISFTSGRGKDFSVDYFETVEKAPSYSESLSKMISSRFKNKEFVDENELKNDNFRQFYTYKVILKSFVAADDIIRMTSNEPDRFKEGSESSQRTFEKLFIINPALWNIFRKENLRSLHYVRAESYEAKKSVFAFIGSKAYTVLSCYGDVHDKEGKIYFDREQVLHYPMKRPYFLNTIYHNIDLYNEE